VFISYSYDSPEHCAWVERLATDLRGMSVSALLDKWEVGLGGNLGAFMSNGIATADRVLLICTREYVEKANAGKGGAGYEGTVITAEVVRDISTKKFIPVIRRADGLTEIPNFLGVRLSISFSRDDEYKSKLDELARELLGVPGSGAPPLGPNPFSGAMPAALSVKRDVGPTGLSSDGRPLLDNDWFREQAAYATERAGKHGAKATMELRFALHDPLDKSQIELLRAAKASEIQTFGWPIGVTLESREEFRPRPVESGIRAEVAINEKGFSGERSYDFWAIRDTGDYYLLQSLFEDERAENKIFFNTRIVRVTESLMFAAKLYDILGVVPEARLSVRVTHRGLAGRELTASSNNRAIRSTTTTAPESQSEMVLVLGEIRGKLVEDVRRIVAPMFMLFDFREFDNKIYEDIVRRFEKGEVS
jgi:hypothetical protein